MTISPFPILFSAVSALGLAATVAESENLLIVKRPGELPLVSVEMVEQYGAGPLHELFASDYVVQTAKDLAPNFAATPNRPAPDNVVIGRLTGSTGVITGGGGPVIGGGGTPPGIGPRCMCPQDYVAGLIGRSSALGVVDQITVYGDVGRYADDSQNPAHSLIPSDQLGISWPGNGSAQSGLDSMMDGTLHPSLPGGSPFSSPGQFGGMTGLGAGN